MESTPTKNTRGVNNLLHTLRGEQFRQMQNMRHSRTHLVSIRNYNSPTLPISLTAPDATSSDEPEQPVQPAVLPTYSGPAPPKSWRPSYEVSDSDATSVEWRRRALSVVASALPESRQGHGQGQSLGVGGNFTTIPRVPSLALLCLQMVLSSVSSSSSTRNIDEFRSDIVPYIPPHLRRDVIRYCAIHAPLPSWKLYALLGEHGNADGEMLIMGPGAALPDNAFIRDGVEDGNEAGVGATEVNPSTRRPQHDWEADDTTDTPLTSLILVSTRLPTSTLLSFPSTLTRLALINLPTPVPLHQLPKTCPLLVVLDLSFNIWLKNPGREELASLERITWSRWGQLEVVGVRECVIPESVLNKINLGRWDDVVIIRE